MATKLVFAAALFGWSLFAQSISVAYSSGGGLYLASDTGQIIKIIRGKVPIGEFVISADANSAVFLRPSPPGANGGQLYLLNIATGKVRRLTHGQVYDKHEVYADPDFSPDGTSIIFAIHVSSRGDAFHTAGPVASMNLQTGKIAILQSTRMWDGPAPVFVDRPRWSPDGLRILLNVQGEFALVTADGKQKQELGPVTAADSNDERATIALGWLWSSCVAYVYHDDQEAGALERAALYILNLNTREKTRARSMLGVPLTGIREFSWPYYTRVEGDSTIVSGPNGSWQLKDAIVRIIPRVTTEDVPASCR